MEQVQCVSLPRSGHNMLVGHLQRYFQSHTSCSKTKLPTKKFTLFGRTKDRQKTHVHPDTSSNFHYCEYYYGCRNHPCVDQHNTFQKSHDFELELPVEQERKYLIQKRDRLDLMISWFEMRLKKNRENDSKAGFQAFLERQRSYLDQFHQKWVEAPIRYRMILDYEAYLNDPMESLTQVIHFFDHDHEVDSDLLSDIVTDVRPAKDNSGFRFASAEAA